MTNDIRNWREHSKIKLVALASLHSIIWMFALNLKDCHRDVYPYSRSTVKLSGNVGCQNRLLWGICMWSPLHSPPRDTKRLFSFDSRHSILCLLRAKLPLCPVRRKSLVSTNQKGTKGKPLKKSAPPWWHLLNIFHAGHPLYHRRIIDKSSGTEWYQNRARFS